jgi:tetratricopeptide (TPR) repeat protein
MEWGKFAESRKLYRKAITAFESLGRYDFLLLVYKNYGLLFEKDYVNYDSASYYFEKAMACADQVEWPTGNLEEVVNAKADLLVEMGNLAVERHDEPMAKEYFDEAFSLAEDNSYHFGLMQAALSLGQLYARQGKATLSLHYLDVYAEESRKSGITMMESATMKPLILDYARLGRFDEMSVELDALDEQKKALERENSDLYDQISTLQDDAAGLLAQYESQNEQIETLQSQRNHYRLAFFGLLAIALFALAVLIAYKIVRKKRVKNVKS